MLDFAVDEGAGFYELGTYSATAAEGSVSVLNAKVPSCVTLYAQVWNNGQAAGPMTVVTSDFGASKALSGEIELKIFVRPDAGANALDMKLSYAISKPAKFGPCVSEYVKIFDICETPSNPCALMITKSVVTNSDRPIRINLLCAMDHDSQPAQDFAHGKQMFAAKGQSGINHQRMLT